MRTARSHFDRSLHRLLAAVGLLAWAGGAGAQLSIIESFDPGLGQLVSIGHDVDTGLVWVYGASDPDIRSYTAAGVFVASLPRPGEGANDVDIDFARATLVLGTTAVPAGTLLFTNGETGTADVYGVATSSGSVLSTLNTAFGASHVVGGAHHVARGTLFLVQDRQTANAATDSLVAELDPETGAVLGSFKTDTVLPGYTVNFGDVDTSAVTGNLYVVSSDETSIAEFTPDGAFVQTHTLPDEVGAPSGIAIDDTDCSAWLSDTSGDVWHLAGLCELEDADADGVVDAEDNCLLVANASQTDTDADGYGNICDADFNEDCIVNFVDLGSMKSGFFGNDPNLDMNDDLTVNFVDLGLLKSGFFLPPGPSGTTDSCAAR
jgi:hypothetical protein